MFLSHNKKILNIGMSFFKFYMIVLVFMVVISFFIIHEYSDFVINNIESDTAFLKSMIDNEFKQLERVSAEMQLINKNYNFIHYDKSADFQNTYAYNLVNQLYNMSVSNDFVDSIFFYYPKSDYVVSNIGCFTSRHFYFINHHTFENYETWKYTFYNNPNFSVYLLENKDLTSNLYFGSYIPFNADSNKTAIFSAEINLDHIKYLLSSIEQKKTNGFVGIFNDKQNMIVGIGDTSLYQQPNAKDNITIIKDSDYVNFQYITITPKKSVLQTIHHIQTIIVILFLSCALFGAVMAFMIGKKESMVVTHMLKESRDIILHTALSEIIQNRYTTQNALKEMFEKYRINFDFDKFIVLVTGYSSRLEHRIIQAFSPHFEIFTADDDHIKIFLLNFEDDDTLVFDKTTQLLDEVFTECKKEEGLYVGIGNVSDMPEKIYRSYTEAFRAFEQAPKIKETICLYKEIVPVSVTERVNDIVIEKNEVQIERQTIADFQNYIGADQYTKAEEVLLYLFEEYLTVNDEMYITRCKKYAVINIVLEKINELSLSFEFEKEKYSDMIFTSGSMAGLENTLIFILQELHAVTQNGDTKIFEKAQKIIDIHYRDNNLGLYMISDLLGVANSYLSKTFKENMKVGISEYINKLRIEKSKELLMEGKMNVKEIAEYVGFSSDINFIRVFKKYENLTPGKYKN